MPYQPALAAAEDLLRPHADGMGPDGNQSEEAAEAEEALSPPPPMSLKETAPGTRWLPLRASVETTTSQDRPLLRLTCRRITLATTRPTPSPAPAINTSGPTTCYVTPRIQHWLLIPWLSSLPLVGNAS